MSRTARPFSLHTLIAVFVCMVVLLSLSITAIMIGLKEANTTKQNLSEKAMNIAMMVADSPLVIAALDGTRSRGDVEPYVSKIRKATGVPFIVVMDLHAIRLSHPVADRIGEHFVGGDELRALKGQTYTSIAKGTLGTSLRAFVPIDDAAGKEVGVVSVGIMLDHIRLEVARSERMIYLGLGVGLFVGVIGAMLLARRIRKILFGLEPHMIAEMYQERTALLESVREGILAVDREGKILVANAGAMRIFERAGISGDPMGQSAEDYLGGAMLGRRVLEGGTAQYDEEQDLNGIAVVLNRVPIKVGDRVVGAVATFRDRTELKQLAEQLTGTKQYADALRAQTHEFMNKLHAMMGMAHIGQYDRLSAYIRSITEGFQMEVGAISHRVKDPVLAGFLVSKLSYARERNVTLQIVGECSLPRPAQAQMTDELITIVGNLLENGFEAVEGQDAATLELGLGYDGNTFSLQVKDTGTGIPEELVQTIFTKGFSTKGEQRGFGLFLVKNSVDRLGGTVSVQSTTQGSTFFVQVPWRRERAPA